MNFKRSLSFIVYSTIMVCFYIQNIQAGSSNCTYGTFYNGASCQDCGLASVGLNFRIVGGVNAAQNSIPSQAYVSSNIGLCGGTLISRKTVMTAGHCVYDASNVKVYLGVYDSTKLGNYITARKILLHPSFSSTSFINDIALIQLSTAVTLSTSVGVACLPQNSSSTYPPPGNGNVVASGWGLTKENGNEANILQNVKLSVLAGSSCSSKYSSFNTSSRICAGELSGGKDTCQGDSGGPLLAVETINGKSKQVVTGITNGGFGCARPNYPGYYARVAYYLDWIKKNAVY